MGPMASGRSLVFYVLVLALGLSGLTVTSRLRAQEIAQEKDKKEEKKDEKKGREKRVAPEVGSQDQLHHRRRHLALARCFA